MHKTKREEIDLLPEDEKILDSAWDQMGKENPPSTDTDVLEDSDKKEKK